MSYGQNGPDSTLNGVGDNLRSDGGSSRFYTIPSSSPHSSRFVPPQQLRQLPPPPGFVPNASVPPRPKVDRASLFPQDSLEYNVISRAFADATAYKDSIFALNALCERLKSDNVNKDIALSEKDAYIAMLTDKLNVLESEVHLYDSKLKQAYSLLDQNVKDTALLTGTILDKNQFIAKSIEIKQEHDLLLPTEEGIDLLSIRVQPPPKDDVINGSGSDIDSDELDGSNMPKDNSSNDADVEDSVDNVEGFADNEHEDVPSKEPTPVHSSQSSDPQNSSLSKITTNSGNNENKIDELRRLAEAFDEEIDIGLDTLRLTTGAPTTLMKLLRLKHFKLLKQLNAGCAFKSFARAKFILFLYYSHPDDRTLLAQGTIERNLDQKTNKLKVKNKLKCNHCDELIAELVLDSKVDNLVKLEKFTPNHKCTWANLTSNYLDKFLHTEKDQGLDSETKSAELHAVFNRLDQNIDDYHLYLSLHSQLHLDGTFFDPFIYLLELFSSQLIGFNDLQVIDRSAILVKLVSSYICNKKGFHSQSVDAVNSISQVKYSLPTLTADHFKLISMFCSSEGFLNFLNDVDEKDELSRLFGVLDGFNFKWVVFAQNRIVAASPTTPDLIILHDISKEGKAYMNRVNNLLDRKNKSSKPVKLYNISELGIVEDVLKSTDKVPQKYDNSKNYVPENKFTFDSTIGEIDSEFWENIEFQDINEEVRANFNSNKAVWQRLKDASISDIIFQNKLPEDFLSSKCLPYLEIDRISINDASSDNSKKKSNHGFNELLMVSIRTSFYENIPLCFGLTATANNESWLKFLSTFYNQNEQFLKKLEICHIITTSDNGVRSAVIFAFNKRKVIFHTSVHHLIKDIQQFVHHAQHKKVENLINSMCHSGSSKTVHNAKIQLLGYFKENYRNEANFAFALVNNFNSTFSRLGKYKDFNVQSIHFTEEYLDLISSFKTLRVSKIIETLASLQKLKLCNSISGYLKPKDSHSTSLTRLGRILYSVSIALASIFTVTKFPDSTYTASLNHEFKEKYPFEQFFKMVKNLHFGYELEPDFFEDRKIQYIELYNSEAKLSEDTTSKNLRYKCSVCIDSTKDRLLSCPHEAALLMFKNDLSVNEGSIKWDYIVDNSQWYKFKYNSLFYISSRLIRDYVPEDADEVRVLPPPLQLSNYMFELSSDGDGDGNEDTTKRRSSEVNDDSTVDTHKRRRLPSLINGQ